MAVTTPADSLLQSVLGMSDVEMAFDKDETSSLPCPLRINLVQANDCLGVQIDSVDLCRNVGGKEIVVQQASASEAFRIVKLSCYVSAQGDSSHVPWVSDLAKDSDPHHEGRIFLGPVASVRPHTIRKPIEYPIGSGIRWAIFNARDVDFIYSPVDEAHNAARQERINEEKRNGIEVLRQTSSGIIAPPIPSLIRVR